MPKKIRRRRFFLVLAVLVMGLVALAALMGKRWLVEMLQPVTPGAKDAHAVQLPPGASSREIGELLYQDKLIKHPVVFRFYAQYLKVDNQLKPGEYQLSPGMTLEEILRKLAKGEVVVYRFTIPEGLTVPQIADVLAKRNLVKKDTFVELARAKALTSAYVPKDVPLKQPMEGYLFPDTYEYKPGITEEQALSLMFGRFETVFTPQMRDQARALGMTVHEVVTLASVIEKEAQVAQERPRISGVYHNRLRIGMKLDADPTVQYALNKPPTEPLLYKDLEVESPYNTYMNPGLPPGPIAAPGLASISAALTPDKHDFLYFVAKADGSGEHFFAATLEEQTANIAKSEANLKKHP